MVSQMKAMEEENRRLKRMYADLSMQADLLKKPSEKSSWAIHCPEGKCGMPPLKWSTNWDMIVPFLGGLNDGWKTRKAGRYRA
jgi:hypothetical protein